MPGPAARSSSSSHCPAVEMPWRICLAHRVQIDFVTLCVPSTAFFVCAGSFESSSRRVTTIDQRDIVLPVDSDAGTFSP